MTKTVLIAGKEFPDGAAFAHVAFSHGRNVVITADSDTAEPAGAQFLTAKWNKSLPVSASSILLFTENHFQNINEAVLIFDAPWFTVRYPSLSVKACTQCLDDMIGSYMFITRELLARFSRKGGGRLVFVFRSGALYGKTSASNGVLTNTAAAAFRAFAENIAVSPAVNGTAGTKAAIAVSLVHDDSAADDEACAAWLFPYLDALDAAKPNTKKIAVSTQWIKCGARSPGGILWTRTKQ